ncbi:unnamed protein product [Prunus armeniaca]
MGGVALRPLPTAPEGSGWGGKSPNASFSNKGWPWQGGVHEPRLVRRQEEPELQPEGALTSAGANQFFSFRCHVAQPGPFDF